MKKRLLVVFLALAMIFALAACGTSSDTTTETASAAEESAEETTGETYNVGVVQLVQHVALDAATEGFQDKLTELIKSRWRYR